jgi:alpha-beta hydrolase superfamily lysophospholipase
VHTPTLRPEQRTRTRPPKELHALSFEDYAADLQALAARITAQTGEKPYVIGHSMGGLLAQALAERDCVRAAVLISPSAPAGARTLTASVMWGVVGFGALFKLTPRAILPERAFAERVVLNAMPPAEREAAWVGMVHESGRAFLDLGTHAIDETRIRVPILTVAAGADRLVPASLVRETAKKYARIGGELKEYPHHGHWLYAEPRWEEAAGELYGWLEAKG